MRTATVMATDTATAAIAYLETGNGSSVLGGLPLLVVEMRGNCDDSLGDLLANWHVCICRLCVCMRIYTFLMHVCVCIGT